jgi:PPOX class probable F420-dependent enzyme
MEAPAQSPTLPASIRAFIAPPRYATIASLNADGSPHQAVVWYLVEGDRLIVNSRRSRRWPKNLMERPIVSLAIYDIAEPEHWVGLRGEARFLHDGEAAFSDIATMATRYGSDPEQYRGQDRVSFEVRVDRWFEYGA